MSGPGIGGIGSGGGGGISGDLSLLRCAGGGVGGVGGVWWLCVLFVGVSRGMGLGGVDVGDWLAVLCLRFAIVMFAVQGSLAGLCRFNCVWILFL